MSVGIVIAATTPIMPKVIKTSAKVKARFFEVTDLEHPQEFLPNILKSPK